MTRALVLVIALVGAFALAPGSPEANERAAGPRVQMSRPKITPLVVILDGKGFQLRPCAGNDCAPGRVTVPMTPKSQYDFRRLRERAGYLRSRYHKSDHPGIRLRVGPRVPWWVAVKTMEVLRYDDRGKLLFPVVMLDLESARLPLAPKKPTPPTPPKRRSP